MDGYERRRQRKKLQIYAAASKLISAYGFAKVSVSEIADEAGVSPATIYNYFGTKDQLYRDMLDYWIERQLEEYEHILASPLPYPDKVKEILTREAHNLKALSADGKSAPHLGDSPLAIAAGSSEDKLLALFDRLAQQGRREGYVHTGFSDASLRRYCRMYIRELGRLQDEVRPAGLAAAEIDDLLLLFFYGLNGHR